MTQRSDCLPPMQWCADPVYVGAMVDPVGDPAAQAVERWDGGGGGTCQFISQQAFLRRILHDWVLHG